MPKLRASLEVGFEAEVFAGDALLDAGFPGAEFLVGAGRFGEGGDIGDADGACGVGLGVGGVLGDVVDEAVDEGEAVEEIGDGDLLEAGEGFGEVVLFVSGWAGVELAEAFADVADGFEEFRGDVGG